MVDGAAPMARGNNEMTRTGISCITNPGQRDTAGARVTPGNRHQHDSQNARPEDDRLRQDQADSEREPGRHDGMQREMQRIDRRRGDGVAEQHFVADEQQRHQRAGAELRDRKHQPVVAGHGRRLPMPDGAPQPFRQLEGEHQQRREQRHRQ